ncbi:MAG: hypothetical protein IJW14_04770 [Oscillospiraceae bacterium]|nr:hypothetical protein [Oscillospiraceae bacterium]
MDWKKIGKAILFPPVWVMAFFTVISTAALIAVFVSGWEQTVIAYISYVLAFYTLSVVCVFCSVVLPKQYKTIKQKLYDIPLCNRFLTDRGFRTTVFLWFSFGFNMLYVCINLWSWYLLRSWWFVVLAVYYVIMAVMRFLLGGYLRKHEPGSDLVKEWKRARICAAILLLINLSLSGAVLMILYQNRGYDYSGILIYVMALYTFYSTIHAIVDIIRFRKLGSPVLSTAKIVSLSAALVSMLNLETAMFAQFGADMSANDQQLMIILTGAGVSITVVTLSTLLMVRSTKEIRRN